jgi:putative membrane protein
LAQFLLRLIINAIALWVAAYFIGGITLETSAGSILLVALIFGLVNALIRPVVAFFTCPFYILTLGLFTFIVNALMLMLTAFLVGNALNVEGFLAALLGGIVISIVSTVLSLVLNDE